MLDLLPLRVALPPTDEVTAANLLISGSALGLMVAPAALHQGCRKTNATLPT